MIQSEQVSADTIYGGISVYLLLALTWSTLYTAAEYVAPGSIMVGGVALSDAYPNTSRLWDGPETIYFSFVTMTTLGYGDMVPVSPVARMCAVLQAVLGQLYLAVLVARLVGLHIVHAERRDQ